MKLPSRWVVGSLVLVSVAGAGLAARGLRKAPVVDEAPCEPGEACRAHLPAGAVPAAEPVRGKPRMLVFSSASCAACGRMAPRVSAAERACRAEADVMHVDVDHDPGEGLATLYGVPLLPSMLSVDANGHEVSRLTGVQPQERIEEALEELRGAECSRVEEAPRPHGAKG